MNQRELFLRHVAQTSPAPLALEIIRAEGSLLTDKNGKEYIDLIGGISVANTGHRHPKVIEAIHRQTEAYLHIMVYGEFIETPQVQYAQLLAKFLPPSLSTVYFTNSGAEAVEGAMKLAKRATNRTRIIAFNNSYHGSTQGALSIIGSEYWRNAFRPLLPGILHLEYNNIESLQWINSETACVIVEAVQAEAGVRSPSATWLKELRRKCDKEGALLILDEIQTGFGRTGSLWAFERAGIVPDVLLLGKALGGGLPLGAFVSSHQLMMTLTDQPVLGHISTFGGHPLSCAAGMAAMQALLDEEMLKEVEKKGGLFKNLLVHEGIKAVHASGLWLALEFESFELNKKIIDSCIDDGLLTDWFLFAPNCLRISPPLNISDNDIRKACDILIRAIDRAIIKT